MEELVPDLPVPDRDGQASDDALAAAYDTLRRLAEARVGKLAPQTLGATDLVHEAVARLLRGELDLANLAPDHLLALASQAMRNVLVDRARARQAVKRGGGQQGLDVDALDPEDGRRDHELIAVDDSLDALSRLDERAARVVELRFFGGLSEVEIAKAIGVTERTVRRDWRFARAWLSREVAGHEEG
ncbi:MAG: ECF-type sigma factor [Planctomycetota bacterium]